MDLISALDLSQKRRIAGRKGAAARWGNRNRDGAGGRGNRGNRRDGNDGNPQAGWDWYQLTNQADDSTAELYIYDEISWWGITAQDLVDELAELGDVDTIDVHLNSPGGQIFDGVAIFNALVSHSATVNVFVDALAASIASVIAMAGDTVTMGRYSQMMIHDGFGVAVGDAEDMRQMADLLDKASDNIASVYADRAGGETAEWRDRMKAESWFSAQEAVKAGLADKVAELPSRNQDPDEAEDEPMEDRMAARHDLSVFRFAGRQQAPEPITSQQTNPDPEPGPRPADPPADPEPTPDPDPDPEPVPVSTAKIDPAKLRAGLTGQDPAPHPPPIDVGALREQLQKGTA